MIVVTTIRELKQVIQRKKKEGKTIGFVPTMGFLHDGHMHLVDQACKKDDVIVTSIFVNPLQFGEGEDYEEYPRDVKRDEELAQKRGVDILFCPSVNEMYPQEMSVQVQVKRGTDVLCGKHRPGHFDGVATVVLKLFHIVCPDRAYFGKKDAQQVAVIENMVNDFHLPVEIIPCETQREKDGLATSSRNVNLTSSERAEAPRIYQALIRGKRQFIEEGKTIAETIAGVKNEIQVHTSGDVDYVELLSYPSLQPPQDEQEKVVLAAAVRFKRVRLIDNVIFQIGEGREQHV